MGTKTCAKNCETCKHLNVRADDKGYPWGYECLKFGDTVSAEKIKGAKKFGKELS